MKINDVICGSRKTLIMMVMDHIENIFGIYTKKDTAEAAKDLIIKELYKKEIARGWMTIIDDISDIEVEILEIDADEIVNIELGGYCE